MDKESTITAPSLSELMDKLDKATPAGMIAVVKEGYPVWIVIFTLKDRI